MLVGQHALQSPRHAHYTHETCIVQTGHAQYKQGMHQTVEVDKVIIIGSMQSSTTTEFPFNSSCCRVNLDWLECIDLVDLECIAHALFVLCMSRVCNVHAWGSVEHADPLK